MVNVNNKPKRSPLGLPFGNATFYWCAGTGLSLFWLGVKAPAQLAGKKLSTAFAVHLTCAGATSVVCMFNLCFSPSQGPIQKKLHRYLGRLGVVTSLTGLAFGYIAAWTDKGVPRASAMGLSVVGILQLKTTLQGFHAIRSAAHAASPAEKNALVKKHVSSMNILFYGTCLGPMWFRIVPWAVEAMAKAAGRDPETLPPVFMFLGMIPATLTPGLAITALAGRRFF